MERTERPLSRKEVNSWDMVSYLSELGHEPQRIRGDDYWYLSPLREERTASFKVSRRGNVWYDHGSGEGGTVLRFCVAYFKGDEQTILEQLSLGTARPAGYRSTIYREPDDPDSHIRIEAVTPLNSSHLKWYLESRKIPFEIAQQYCREVSFSLYRKTHRAIGFENRFGGYELRNAGFKGSSSPKDITLIETGAKDIVVFEGFFDFLSYRTALQKPSDSLDFLILNSTSFVHRAIPFLEPYSSVGLYLDQGPPARLQTQKLLTQLPKARDKSSLYKGFDDLNEWHCQSKSNLRKMHKLKVRR